MKNDSDRKQKTNAEVRKQINQLAGAMLQELIRENNGDNVIFSPLSVYTMLSILADTTAGKTLKEITGVLCEEKEFNQNVRGLSDILQEVAEGGMYSSANAVIVREDVQQNLTPQYENRLRELFDGRLFTTDNIAVHLDTWGRQSTKSMIPSIYDDSMKEMMLCMINACSFVAGWQNQYEEGDIQNEDFHNADQTVSRVKMLHSYETTYVENETFTGFVKPYEDQDFCYLVLLPKHRKLSIENLKGELNFAELICGVDNTFANVLMPEFNCTTDTDLTSIMKKLGICTVFTPQADFSPLSSEWLRVDSIKHKAKIEVDRKGTKAAAVTCSDFVCGAMPTVFPEEKLVLVNRPFIYAVVHNETGVPVFLGAVNHLDTPEGETDLMTNQEKLDVCQPIYERICGRVLDEDGILRGGYDRSLWHRIIEKYRKLDLDGLNKIAAQVCRK